ncbi:CvpA family protein [Caulobacter sp. 602-1]|uniref:CvpA family protein n=1 Tax=Caulobacter sp. 602-1 TaxID=2492472 RepID=UPI000F62FF5F|nr:CvpA family protein [Caulobacter sp. 602-1]RRN64102.1 CvpA family protein [Caulobacter sp. 602-1]
MTPFDIIAGLLLLVSGVTGWVRGASRELTSALSFIIAAAISLFGLRVSGPIFRSLMDPDWAATAAAIVVVFVVFFLIIRLIGGQLTASLHETSAGTLDRAVGATFGVIRAVVILGVFNLLLHLATPPDRMPHWVQDSIFYPLSQASGAVLKVFAPKGKALAGKLAPAIKEAVHEGGDNTSGENSSDKGYDDDQRRKLDDLVEKSR